MKNLLALITIGLLIMLFPKTSKSQPWISMGIGTTVNAGAGMLVSGIEISAAYQHPWSRTDKPAVLSGSIGKMILLSHNDEDNFSFTPSAGIAMHSYKDFSGYLSGETDKTPKVKEVKAIYGLEAGKDWYLGRLTVSTQYSGKFFWGIGIRCFFDR